MLLEVLEAHKTMSPILAAATRPCRPMSPRNQSVVRYAPFRKMRMVRLQGLRVLVKQVRRKIQRNICQKSDNRFSC